jgi:DNA polymerase III subunit epsilon
MQFLIIDCETTGLEEADEPITIGALLCRYTELRDGTLLETYYSKQQPSREISYEAQAIHGITKQQLLGKLFDLDNLRRLIDSAEFIIAHNARFDARMIYKVMPSIINKSWRCTYNQLTYPDEMHRESLDSLCSLNSVERSHPHNALRDCESLLNVLNKRQGKTTRSNTYLGRVVKEPEWPVFSKRHPMLRLESTNHIVFSEINEPRLLECVGRSPIKLWTMDHLDFVVGYSRYGQYHGRQGEVFRFLKTDNPHVSYSKGESDDYVVQSYSDNTFVIGQSG